jgi:hypothetical protein
MFKRLNLCGNDIKPRAKPHPVDPDQQGGVGWLAYDWDDFASREVGAFTQPPVQRQRYVYVCPRCFWTLGDPLR